MAHIEVIDLTADNSEDEALDKSPRKAVLAAFQPRKESRPCVASIAETQRQTQSNPPTTGVKRDKPVELSRPTQRLEVYGRDFTLWPPPTVLTFPSSESSVPVTKQCLRDILVADKTSGFSVVRDGSALQISPPEARSGHDGQAPTFQPSSAKRPAPEVKNSGLLPVIKRARTTADSYPGLQQNYEKQQRDAPKGRSSGILYSHEEDQLLRQLKEVDGLSWEEIEPHFPRRSRGSLQVRYSTKAATRSISTQSKPSSLTRKSSTPDQHRDSSPTSALGRSRRKRKSHLADGFVSWVDVEDTLTESQNHEMAIAITQTTPERSTKRDRAFPSSLDRVLRQRELGLTSRRAWSASHTITEEMKNHVYKSYTLQRQYQKTSGDVVSLSWSCNGTHFAAGSIAISDANSMQYNMPNNLLLGNAVRGEVFELPDHHISRPIIDDAHNINGQYTMRASQDPRLFLTITATAFSKRGNKLFTSGNDKKLRCYTLKETEQVKCRYEVEHPATVDLLSVHSEHDIVATGCHSASDSINITRCKGRTYLRAASLSPRRNNLQSSVPIYPTSLKWGIAHVHQNLLLAGFSGDSDKEISGETSLWEAETGRSIPLRSATRNVFEVAWNPLPTAASISFVVASGPSGLEVGRGTRTVVQCFAPNQKEGRRVLTLECPATDINDLVFCPYDENLIAAGATNGAVYIWDQRFAGKSQQPLHVLRHGITENVLDHDRDEEEADTGVRFLAWGATKSRLYSGSSDGIVKTWNPYRAAGDTHVEDIIPQRHQRSAIMSGAFSPDFCDLLIGTEDGSINLFNITTQAVPRVQVFNHRAAPSPASQKEDPLAAARQLLESEQIQMRPLGAMPVRQAVQGPRYSGPYAPSREDLVRARQTYVRASDRYSTMTGVNRAATFDHETYDDKGLVKATKDLEEAKFNFQELTDRFEHASNAKLKASQFQRSLLDAEQARHALTKFSPPEEPCRLQCSVLDTTDEIEDSRRSELRIPGALRSVNVKAARSKAEEPDKDCIVCFPRTAKRRAGTQHKCASCALRAAGLTTVCSKCFGPARVGTDLTKRPLCESCSFDCFRCGNTFMPAQFSSDRVTCSSCGLSWEAGVLGYDLIDEPVRHPRKNTNPGSTSECHDDWEEFAVEEPSYYELLWQGKEAAEY